MSKRQYIIRNAGFSVLLLLALGLSFASPANGQADQSGQQQQADQGSAGQGQAGASTEDLQKQVQNPISSLISVPFQNNIDFGIIQPVVPFKLSVSVMLIARTIFPEFLEMSVGASQSNRPQRKE